MDNRSLGQSFLPQSSYVPRNIPHTDICPLTLVASAVPLIRRAKTEYHDPACQKVSHSGKRGDRRQPHHQLSNGWYPSALRAVRPARLCNSRSRGRSILKVFVLAPGALALVPAPRASESSLLLVSPSQYLLLQYVLPSYL